MRIFCTFLVLAVCSAANAGLTIQFTPGTNPVQPGNTTDISIISAGMTANVGLFIGVNGPAVASLVNPVNVINPSWGIFDGSGDPGLPFSYRWLFVADLSTLQIPAPQMPNGVVISGIHLLFESPGAVEVVIFDPESISHGGASYEYDRDTLTVVPEPMTLGLLALGGLLLRGRRRAIEEKIERISVSRTS